jgi:hypothetical protein
MRKVCTLPLHASSALSFPASFATLPPHSPFLTPSHQVPAHRPRVRGPNPPHVRRPRAQELRVVRPPRLGQEVQAVARRGRHDDDGPGRHGDVHDEPHVQGRHGRVRPPSAVVRACSLLASSLPRFLASPRPRFCFFVVRLCCEPRNLFLALDLLVTLEAEIYPLRCSAQVRSGARRSEPFQQARRPPFRSRLARAA